MQIVIALIHLIDNLLPSSKAKCARLPNLKYSYFSFQLMYNNNDIAVR